jgi:hypothetical protein
VWRRRVRDGGWERDGSAACLKIVTYKDEFSILIIYMKFL